jgi:hypothetical protein
MFIQECRILRDCDSSVGKGQEPPPSGASSPTRRGVVKSVQQSFDEFDESVVRLC